MVYKDAESNLRDEFPKDYADKFEFIYFAKDDVREGSTVKPGIGGFITQRLGLGTDMKANNRYIPELVQQRAAL